MGGRGSAFDKVAESAAFDSALKAEEDRIKSNPVETAVLLDKDGSVIFSESQGMKDGVAFTPDQVKAMRNHVLTHNHPGGSTFSIEDLTLLVYSGAKEIRATSTGRTYSLKKMRGSYPDRGDIVSDFQDAKAANKAICDKKYQTIESNYASGRTTFDEYARQCDDLNQELNQRNSDWLKDSAKRYGYRYSITGGK